MPGCRNRDMLSEMRRVISHLGMPEVGTPSSDVCARKGASKAWRDIRGSSKNESESGGQTEQEMFQTYPSQLLGVMLERHLLMERFG